MFSLILSKWTNEIKLLWFLKDLSFSQVDLILQGDDVTRQMWHMYSVFEEIFGHQATAAGEQRPPLKQVVVGDKIKKASLQQPRTTTTATRVTENTLASPEKVSTITFSTAGSTTSTIGMWNVLRKK